jgi:predicted enzyme related to lactoylglutathione lyase
MGYWTMLSGNSIVAFVPTKDSARARAFYEDVLGLRFLSEDGFAVVMKAKDNKIRIVKMKDFAPAQYTILGWEVADITSAVQELTRRGVVFSRYSSVPQDELGIWTTPDKSKVAWFNDPDGNVLSVSQHPNTPAKDQLFLS